MIDEALAYYDCYFSLALMVCTHIQLPFLEYS